MLTQQPKHQQISSKRRLSRWTTGRSLAPISPDCRVWSISPGFKWSCGTLHTFEKMRIIDLSGNGNDYGDNLKFKFYGFTSACQSNDKIETFFCSKNSKADYPQVHCKAVLVFQFKLLIEFCFVFRLNSKMNPKLKFKLKVQFVVFCTHTHTHSLSDRATIARFPFHSGVSNCKSN